MSAFRWLGRQVEVVRHLAKQTTNGTSIIRCDACGAWLPSGSEYCLYCGHQPPHAVLEVAQDASESVVKAAAREKLKETHPDTGGSQQAFQRVKRARDQLLNK